MLVLMMTVLALLNTCGAADSPVCLLAVAPLFRMLAAADIDACLDAPCAKNMDCFDLPKPAGGGLEGRACNCTPGTAYVDELMGCLGKYVCFGSTRRS